MILRVLLIVATPYGQQVCYNAESKPIQMVHTYIDGAYIVILIVRTSGAYMIQQSTNEPI